MLGALHKAVLMAKVYYRERMHDKINKRKDTGRVWRTPSTGFQGSFSPVRSCVNVPLSPAEKRAVKCISHVFPEKGLTTQSSDKQPVVKVSAAQVKVKSLSRV